MLMGTIAVNSKRGVFLLEGARFGSREDKIMNIIRTPPENTINKIAANHLPHPIRLRLTRRAAEYATRQTHKNIGLRIFITLKT